jgi:subtilisin family serine protease
MHSIILSFLVVIGVSSLNAADPPAYVPGRLLVGHRANVDAAVLDGMFRMHGAVVRRHSRELAFVVLDVAESSSQAIMESLKSTGLFTYVERDYYAHTAAVPNDPSYVSQWHLPRIHSPEAWGVTTGSASVVVAVLDSGVDETHADLKSKIVPGWNFVHPNTGTLDVLGHGTAVAGTVGAASNNSIGIAGVNWASRIMPLVVVDENDFAAYSDISSAIQFAADHGVRVVNASVGGPNASDTLQNAVNYAWNKGTVIFAAAMNNGTSSQYFPAACTHVVAISATDTNDQLASFSNYGNWITLAAPGTSILTTVNGGGYTFWNGTSFSAPIVAGVAALCLAVNPSLTNADLVSLLKQTADDIGAPGWDTSFGWGRVNAFRAVNAAQSLLPAVVAPPRHPQPVNPSGTRRSVK